MKFVGAELENRIEITVENNWDLRFAPNFANTIEHAADCRARGQRALRRELIHDSIRQRIGEWQPELEHIGAGFFQGECKIDSAFQIRIARADVGNETLALFLAEAREAIVDPIVHQTE